MALRLYIRKCFFFIIINEPKIICKFRSFVYITLFNSFSFLFFFLSASWNQRDSSHNNYQSKVKQTLPLIFWFQLQLQCPFLIVSFPFQSFSLLAAWEGGLRTRLCVLVDFQLPRQQFLVLCKYVLPFSASRYLRCGGRQPGREGSEKFEGIKALFMVEGRHHPRSEAISFIVTFVYISGFITTTSRSIEREYTSPKVGEFHAV